LISSIFLPIDSSTGLKGSISNDPTNNVLRYASVTSFVMEVPLSCCDVSANNGVVGAWTRTKSLTHNSDGTHVVGAQNQRLGNPLINELVIGLPTKDMWNTQNPSSEIQFAEYVLTPTFPEILDYLLRDKVNKLLDKKYETIAPTPPRNDLVATFFDRHFWC